jgi:hypothetical protein
MQNAVSCSNPYSVRLVVMMNRNLAEEAGREREMQLPTNRPGGGDAD